MNQGLDALSAGGDVYECHLPCNRKAQDSRQQMSRPQLETKNVSLGSPRVHTGKSESQVALCVPVSRRDVTPAGWNVSIFPGSLSAVSGAAMLSGKLGLRAA